MPQLDDNMFISYWDFGDGNNDTIRGMTTPAIHTYRLTTLPATVFISLKVTDESGNCYDSYTTQMEIRGPVASFTDDGHKFPCPEEGRVVSFTNTSTGNPVWFYWNFGDSLSGAANESNEKDPIHDYKRTGEYDVVLVVEDNIGCRDTLPVPKHVFIDGPIGDFTYGELSGCLEHTVTFTPSNIYADSIIVNPDKANPIKVGGTDVHNPLSYTFTSIGAYPPYFYLIKWINNNGTWERCVVEWEAKDTIFVLDIIPDFETDSIYCPQGDEVTFPNTSELMPDILELDSAIWTFGNGDSLQAIDGRTKYSTSGTYTITMTVYAKNCVKQISKNVEVIDLPKTVYTDPDSANICGDELMVDFTAAFADDLPPSLSPQQEWIFDDGEIIYGTPASRTFYNSGIYPYKLLITFGQSNCVHTYLDTIRVQVRAFPTAEFEANPQTANYGEEIQFVDKSIQGDGKLIYWYWTFGDSTDSYQQNPVHGYTTTSGELSVFFCF
jgi:PKD repeat protein